MSDSSKKGKPKFNPIRDIMAGVIMAGTSVPQLVAYAETVGYAGYRGLATAGPSLLAWGLATGSPWMNAGVTSLTALMAKADLNGEEYVTQFGEDKYVDLVSSYSLYVGIASFILGLVGFGKLASKVPKTVRAGFKWGCALGVLNAAIPNGVLGNGKSTVKEIVSSSPLLADVLSFIAEKMPAASGAMTLAKIFFIVTHPNYWSAIPCLIFFICTPFVMYGKSYLPKFCPPGTEVIIATALATVYSIQTGYADSYATVGEIPTLDSDAGMSFLDGKIQLPIEVQSYKYLLFDVPITSRFNDSYIVLGMTAAIFAAINFLSIVGIASGFETENGISWSASGELYAQGIACIVAGITGSAPVSGSLSRSLVSRMAGTTSQFGCIVTALCWILFLPYMSIMTPTPKSALSAVIVSAVVKGVLVPKDLIAMKSWQDRVVGWGTAMATACTSPTLGFGTGCVLTLIVGLINMIVGGGEKVKRQ